MDRKLVIMVALCLSFWVNGYGQGCSDAGFCTAGALQGNAGLTDSTSLQNSFGASMSFGIGEKSTSIAALQLEARLAISKRGYIEAKLSVNYASGKLGSHAGIGDLIVAYSTPLLRKSTNAFTGTIGSRISTGTANAKDNNIALPMPYQANLGTTDVIAGVNAKVLPYLNVAAGYQQPVIQYNENSYLPYYVYPTVTTGNDYFASKNLKRSSDVLLRIEGTYSRKKLTIGLGPLLIYHLKKDEFTNQFGETESLTGSDGLTVNIAGSLSYLGKKGKLELSGGTPIVVRDYRPDGLTRAVVLTLHYSVLR